MAHNLFILLVLFLTKCDILHITAIHILYPLDTCKKV